jgi:hypothetical protein
MHSCSQACVQQDPLSSEGCAPGSPCRPAPRALAHSAATHGDATMASTSQLGVDTRPGHCPTQALSGCCVPAAGATTSTAQPAAQAAHPYLQPCQHHVWQAQQQQASPRTGRCGCHLTARPWEVRPLGLQGTAGAPPLHCIHRWVRPEAAAAAAAAAPGVATAAAAAGVVHGKGCWARGTGQAWHMSCSWEGTVPLNWRLAP